MKDLTVGKIGKNMFLFALPLLVATMLSRITGIVDQIMVGQFLGQKSLAAVGSTASFVTVISAFLWATDMGIVMYVTPFINVKDSQNRVVSLIKAFILMIIAVSMIVVVVGLLLQPVIFSMLKINQEIYAESRTYFLIVFVGRVFIAISACTNALFNMFGKSSHALKTSLIVCCGNVVLNYLLIKVIPLGIAGAAIATVVALAIAFVVDIVLLNRELKRFYPHQTKPKMNGKDLLCIFKLTLPCMVQQGVLYLGSALIQPVVNGISTSTIAAYAVCNSIYDICTIFFYCASKAISFFSTQCISKQKYSFIPRGLVVGVMFAILFSVLPVGSIMIFPKQIASIFVKDGAFSIVPSVVKYVYYCFPFIVFAIINNCFHNFFRGILKPNCALIATCFYSVVRVVVSYLAVPTMKFSGVFLGFVVAWVAESVFNLTILVFSLRQIKKIQAKN